MIAFEVQLNGRKLCVAGVGAGVLTVVVDWVGRRSRGDESSQAKESGLTLHIGGLEAWGNEAGQSLKWLHDALQVGDSVSIQVLEVPTADPPLTREPADPHVSEEVERMKYEALRAKYEPQIG